MQTSDKLNKIIELTKDLEFSELKALSGALFSKVYRMEQDNQDKLKEMLG